MDTDQPPSIAIVGAAGVFPGAPNLTQFWENIASGVDAVQPVPPDRWPVPAESVYDPAGNPDKARSLNAGLVEHFSFDAEGFAVDPETLSRLDPMHHLVLETGRTAWQNCRYDAVDPNRVDVILAAIALPTDAASRLTRTVFLQAAENKLFRKASRHRITLSRHEALAGNVTSFPAALLGAALRLGGSTLTLDAACASSLFAVKLACDALQTGRADAVLAGGVARPDTLYTQIGFTQLQALSRSGRCAPFDRSADGLVVGEGCGMVVLKRLEDALTHGDKVYGLIRGTGISNDMRGNLLAPDTEGQLRAMQAAYADAGWQPSDVDLIECHGAATPVGDATELRSLKALWGKEDWQPEQCPIGSIKSMIGHLLTAAGAAGLIKVVLGLQHRTLPPSLHFQSAPPDSPLIDSPFRVQTRAATWVRRDDATPRRAAVSAFGFGGINAHLLVEEWRLPSEKAVAADAVEILSLKEKPGTPLDPVAVVGMGVRLGSANSLRAFQEAVFNGLPAFQSASPLRWKNCEFATGASLEDFPCVSGAYIENFELDLADFRIPPKEIPDILPQHLLMLKVAQAAMGNARLDLRHERPRMGCIIGMEFDLENTNFQMRWDTQRLAGQWNAQYNLGLSEEQVTTWASGLSEAFAPPLTHTRTLGALGGLIASRVAREFRFGGPSFTVSDDTASGLKALGIAVHLLEQQQVDAMLVGAVDLPGDLRRMLKAEALHSFSRHASPRSLDHQADGTLPGEGAAALVLKRLTDARRDGDRIYAVIRGLGAARGGLPFEGDDASEPLTRALAAGLREANVSQDAIGYVETHGSGIPEEDRAEIQALANIFVEGKDASVALGALKSCLGYAGAAAGLAGFVKTALCLFHQIIPPLPRFEAPPDMPVLGGHVHVPIHPFFWPADRSDLPRRACLNALTVEGNAVSVVLEEYSPEGSRPIDLLQTAPAGIPEHGLFVIAGDTVDRLSEGLGHLVRHIEEKRRAGHSLGIAALDWFHRHRPDPAMPAALTLNLADYSACDRVFHEAHQALDQRKSVSFPGRSGCHFSPRPWGNSQRPAFIYPGSGSHYPGMGRQLSVQWPVIWRNANRRTERFAAQCRFPELMPYRLHWPHHWGQDAMKALNADPVTAIHGQVVFGCLATDLLGFMGVVPSAVIGYSLGETVGYFATGAWPDRGHMLERMERSDLFRTQLAGPCLAVRSHLPLAEDIPVNWRVAVVNRPAPVVRDALQDVPAVRLLVTNTPEECVIGGHGPAVEHLIHLLDCEAVYLEGVVAVHWEAVHAVSETYRDLHLFPTAPPSGIAYYSCAEGKRLALTSENAADSLLKQAIEGFDFPATIEQAYRDGARVFLEVGPRGSCTRMIRSILDDRPHLALTISSDPENEVAGLARALGILAAERLPVRLERYFPPQEAVSFSVPKDPTEHAHHSTTVYCGGVPLDPPHPPETVTSEKGRSLDADPDAEIDLTPVATNDFSSQAGHLFFEQTRAMIRDLTNQTSATSDAHQRFLELTENLNRQYVQAVDLQTRLLDQARRKGLLVPETPVRRPPHPTPTKTAAPGQPETRAPHHQPPVVYDRKMCMEFAVGSIARVLGPEFAAVDRFPARVRLPDEPLMLVDRILCVEGKKGILGPGRIVTEHDVLPGAWYLDGDRAPVCVSVEAGQADLFLSSYLGIDLEVKGERTYRLLDAAVTFHRGLPRPGDVIRYEIAIEKFIRQGPTWLFFFHFDGTIDGRPMITMRNGCAGFFTEQEVRHSGGIILTEEDTQPQRGILPENWHPPVPMVRESYNEAGLDALRRGDLGACFGPSFDGLRLPGGQHLPGGRMALIHRVLVLEPTGGRYGIGMIRAEADIRPDDWFLTCHFVDDMVMPGTLMYECCAHTLRIYLQRMGWVSGRTEAAYEPVIGRQAVLKCRGPVTPETRKVIYEVEISEIGFHPEPYAVADAHMYADGHRIVLFRGMTMQLTGMDQEALEEFWRQRRPARPTGGHNEASAVEEPPFSRERLIEFATGRPSKAFGAPYRPFDQERFIARLPAPPYAFIDRITRIDPPPWVLAPDGWVETECDVDSRAWYYRSNGAPFMPICILMEIALQACGFLAAYMGSALQSEKDLHFRNLDGEATLHTNIRSHAGPVHTRARLVQFSAAGDMLIEHYAFEVRQAETLVYEGRTSFGFFTPEALANQVGLPEADQPPALEVSKSTPVLLEDLPPLTPEDPQVRPFGNASSPSRALRMIDRIEYFDPQGGPQGLGHVRGSKTIDPDEWFFKAHFFHDPVWPGSLGIESLIQLLRFAAAALWPEQFHTHALELSAPAKHAWRYRGQVLPTHKRVEVDAIITDRRNHPSPMIRADGYLKCDGLSIYKMHNFGLLLTPRDNP